MTDKVREQILAIRATGETNMFDIPRVQTMAFHESFYELVDFLETNRKEYVDFILYGIGKRSLVYTVSSTN